MKIKIIFGVILCFILTFIFAAPLNAFQVDPLPADNLIQNPWFRKLSDPNKPGLDLWTNVNNDWTNSQKISNPTADLLYSGRCTGTKGELTYCGTSAKISAIFSQTRISGKHRFILLSASWVAHPMPPSPTASLI